MVHYKLTYFNARGVAETSRQLFFLAGEPFEDNRLTEQEFLELKPTLPTGQVPILYIDGVPYSQSASIARYLARKFGFAGKTAEEELSADVIVDTFKDFVVSYTKFVIAVLSKESSEKVNEIREVIMKPAVNTYTSFLKRIIEKSKSGYLVGDGLTWADLLVADNLATLITFEFIDAENHKPLFEFHKKVVETPKLKEWLEKRPETKF